MLFSSSAHSTGEIPGSQILFLKEFYPIQSTLLMKFLSRNALWVVSPSAICSKNVDDN